jgi:large-conductance mechanosensitive channel
MIQEFIDFTIIYFTIFIVLLWLLTIKEQLNMNNKYNNNKTGKK